MSKFISLLKSVGIDYLLIYLSFIITGFIDYIYLYIIGFHGDVGQFYTYILYMIGGFITSLISLIIYKIIFFIFYKKYHIQNYILVLSLVLIGLIQIGVWGYGNFLFDNRLLSKYPFIEFGFYYSEEFLLSMHFIYYILAGLIITYRSIFRKNVLTKN